MKYRCAWFNRKTYKSGHAEWTSLLSAQARVDFGYQLENFVDFWVEDENGDKLERLH